MIKFPFTTLQQCNLDWIMQQLHRILDFIPMNGSPGDVLQRNVDGAAWMPIAAVSLDIHGLNTIADVSPADELPIYDNSMQGNFKVTVSDLLDNAPVQSVNGMTGDVILDYADVGALPDTTPIPDSTSDLVNDSGFVDAAGAAAAAPVQSVNGQTGSVTIMQDQLFFGNSLQTLVASVDTDLDAGNDCAIVGQDIRLAVSDDKKTIRLCGMMEITPSTTAGWRTFLISGADIADITGSYVHCDYTCDLYSVLSPADGIYLSSYGSYANYRVMADKTIRLYVSIGSGMISAGNNLVIKLNGIPIQIAK